MGENSTRPTPPPLLQRVDLHLAKIPDKGQAIQIGDNAPLFA